jgi:hypothetical protein
MGFDWPIISKVASSALVLIPFQGKEAAQIGSLSSANT